MGDRSSALLEIPVTSVRPNPHQPRHHFDEDTLGTLTASVRELGVLQPILVREIGEGDYELVAGERRWRAARRAGLPTIPAIVRTVTDVASIEQALVENLHREGLNPLEEAAAYQQLIEDFGLTHEQLSVRIGRSRVSITNTLRLFQLPPSVQKLVADGQLSAGHARALLGTPDRSYQEALAKRALSDQLSVRAVEEAVRDRNELGGSAAVRSAPGPAADERPTGIVELEELLSARLDTRVKVDLRSRHGKVVIEFATLEDLERIYRAMTDGAPTDQG